MTHSDWSKILRFFFAFFFPWKIFKQIRYVRSCCKLIVSEILNTWNTVFQIPLFEPEIRILKFRFYFFLSIHFLYPNLKRKNQENYTKSFKIEKLWVAQFYLLLVNYLEDIIPTPKLPKNTPNQLRCKRVGWAIYV